MKQQIDIEKIKSVVIEAYSSQIEKWRPAKSYDLPEWLNEHMQKTFSEVKESKLTEIRNALDIAIINYEQQRTSQAMAEGIKEDTPSRKEIYY